MDDENDVGYYRRREAASRELADAARDDSIRNIHIEMADRYGEKARELAAAQPLRIDQMKQPSIRTGSDS